MNPALPEAERLALAGKGPIVLRDRELSAPLKTRRPAVIGVQFMGDLFHESVPDEFIADVYAMMWQSGPDSWIADDPMSYLGNGHSFLILTKRVDRMTSLLSSDLFWEMVVAHGALDNRPIMPLPFIWHGLTICNQEEADAKIPEFLKVPGKKFLSIEPMLGLMDFSYNRFCGVMGWGPPDPPHKGENQLDRLSSQSRWVLRKIDAVILGGETGHGARPMHPDWVRSVRDQCEAAGVPFFLKSLGQGKGRELDGREHNDLPWRVPWATDGKASADKIEILQVFDTKTGEDVTDKYRRRG